MRNSLMGASLGLGELVVLSGCMCQFYTSDVGPIAHENGVVDFQEVSTLDYEEYPSSMPVVVNTQVATSMEDNDISILLWGLTLGIVPGCESYTTTYKTTITTPLGERSGEASVTKHTWLGWIPLFLPMSNAGEEVADEAKSELCSNLVSQFSRDEYETFVKKFNSPEQKAKRAEEAAERERLAKERAQAERARLEKEAAERAEKMRLAMRNELYEKTVENDLAAIKKCYSNGGRFENPFLGERRRNRDEKTDWLAKWASFRLGMTEADALAGEALLSEFGTKYLPNAYANYEKKREALAELQQIFNEEFSEPWTIKTTNPKWNSFNKVLEKFVKARTECFICHDELCYYWLLGRFGVLSDKDFARIDTQRLAIHLLPENVERAGYTLLRMNLMEGKVSDFAVKYAPESNAIYQKMGDEFKELDALLSEVFKQHIQMDDARYSRVLAAAVAKRNDLVREMNTLSLQLQSWYMDYMTMEKSSEDIAKCDAETSKYLKPFMDALPLYIKEHALGPIIAKSEMIAIPGRRYQMQRTEVTQLQWMAVMGNNPSSCRGPDHPVENVSWDDCQEFIKRASQMDGREYRLPKEEEWEFACRAGSTTDWGRRANGECGPLETMGWYNSNTSRGSQVVALKEPNAWGLYDMHGNVWEWCENIEYRGGGWDDDSSYCAASSRGHTHNYHFGRSDSLGFRIAASLGL